MKTELLNVCALILLISFFVLLSGVMLVNVGIIDSTPDPEIHGLENTTGVPVVEASVYPGIDGTKLENAIYEEVNERRLGAGIDRLIHSERVRLIARLHSKDMAHKDYFNHTNPNGLGSAERHNKYSGCKNTNENILRWNRIPTNRTKEIAEAVVDSWANSSGHNKSMMTSYDHVTGVGVYVTENKTLYVTQDFCREHSNA